VSEVWAERSDPAIGAWERVVGEVLIEGEFQALTDRGIEPGRRYRYRLVAVTTGGERMLFGPLEVVGGAAERDVSLRWVGPHPSPGSAVIEFVLPHDARVRLQVLDVQGRVVSTLVDEARSAGWHRAEWRAEDRQGASGVYFVRLQAGDRVLRRRAVVTR
jgi:hypothetical protein